MERRPEVRAELGTATGDAGLDLTGGCSGAGFHPGPTRHQSTFVPSPDDSCPKCCNLKLGCGINAGLDDWQMWQMNSKTFVTSISWGFRGHLP